MIAMLAYRSYLFVPADSSRKLDKAGDSDADALIVDLEDSVSAEHKDMARMQAAGFLAESLRPARFVRVNALSTGRTEGDIAATVAHRPAGYVLPKCEGPDQIEALSSLILRHRGHEDIRIIAIATESVRAVRRLMREDWAHPRLGAITWGGEDLAADMGALRNRDENGSYLGPFRLAREVALLAGLEAGIAPIDSVYTAFRESAGLESEARAARQIGFVGKLAIHPDQVPVINSVFTPTDEQLDWAREVIRLMDDAESGVARLDGEMLDAPHLRRARRILSTAPRTGPPRGR